MLMPDTRRDDISQAPTAKHRSGDSRLGEERVSIAEGQIVNHVGMHDITAVNAF
jgi:hypothetical protein